MYAQRVLRNTIKRHLYIYVLDKSSSVICFRSYRNSTKNLPNPHVLFKFNWFREATVIFYMQELNTPLNYCKHSRSSAISIHGFLDQSSVSRIHMFVRSKCVVNALPSQKIIILEYCLKAIIYFFYFHSLILNESVLEP